MNTTNPSRSSVNELKQQTARFSREVFHLINVLLNCIFALTLKGKVDHSAFNFVDETGLIPRSRIVRFASKAEEERQIIVPQFSERRA